MEKYKKTEWIPEQTLVSASNLNKIENQLEKSNHDHLGKSKREKKERYILRKDFWTIVLNKLKDRTNLFNAVSPSESSWLGANGGYKSDKEKLDAIGENLAECMTRFEKAFAKYIKDLKI